MVIAVDGHNNVVSSSKFIYVSAKGNKKCSNYNKVKVKAKVITLKKGKTAALKGKAIASKHQKVKKKVGLRYESSNPQVVKVSSKGKLRALKKGTANIYVFAQNGVVKKVKVRVK